MELWAKGVSKLEQVLPMEGSLAVPARFAIGAGVGYLVMSAIRPEFAYTPEGQPREDAVFPGLFPGAQPATFTPWWTGPLVGGLALVTLI